MVKVMDILELAAHFIWSGLKSIEVQICGLAITAGAVVDNSVGADITPVANSIWIFLEHGATVGKFIVYVGGAIAFIWNGGKGAWKWWKERKEK